MFEIYLDELINFFQRGGFVLFIVFGVAFFLWTLLLERFIYINFTYKKDRAKVFEELEFNHKNSVFKDEIKRFLVEEISTKLKSGLDFIKTLIIVCPLIGLLGTVTGMIEVFDVMAITGTNNAKSMADGVSMATIPTMAGMVVALSGILFEKRLESNIEYKKQKLELELAKVI